jgi:gliding motility-associated-like protein
MVSGPGNEQMETMQSGMAMLTVTDQLGCSASRSVNIILPEPGILSAVTDCSSHVFQFNGVPVIESEANSYRWDFGDGTGSDLKNPQHTYPSAGTYQVSLTITEDGCIHVYRDVVTAETPPMVGIDKDPRFCPGDSVLIHGTGAITYRWNDGSTGDSKWISREGDYSVTGTSASGCQATYNFRASYYDMIGYTIQSDQEEVSQGTSRIRFWSENIPYSAYHWDFGDGQSGQGAEVYHSYDISEDGYLDVNLTVINPNGCEEIATKRIWKSVTAVVNTFTPNGDGINDIYLKGWQIQVFNRNGILMYQGDEGWDGKHNGRPVDNDTYFVIIYDSTRLGAEYKKSYVTVLR